jgi:hypothetical protein
MFAGCDSPSRGFLPHAVKYNPQPKVIVILQGSALSRATLESSHSSPGKIVDIMTNSGGMREFVLL